LRIAAEMRPDVVILDIGLPGMSGHEVARRLRQDKTYGKCLIVALSGYGREEHIPRAIEAGVDHCLVKPADPSALLDSIAMSEDLRGSDNIAVS
jgi:CheY-like chemotaxis protein